MKEIRKKIAVCASFIFWTSLVVLTIGSLSLSFIGPEKTAFLQMSSMIVGCVAFAVLLIAGGVRTNEEYLEYLEQREDKQRQREKRRQRRNRR